MRARVTVAMIACLSLTGAFCTESRREADAFPLSCLAQSPTEKGQTVRFSGYDWEVRGAGDGGPGPNHWDPDNVRVDSRGWLHLKFTNVQGEWRCAELNTQKRFGFGRYQFQVVGRIDTLDQNVVLGLFTYPARDVGVDGTNEIDIEFARWGNARADNGSYTVYPASGKRAGETDHHTFNFKLQGDSTTHRFDWKPDRLIYRSVHGHRDDDEPEIAHWDYVPDDRRLIPQTPTPIHLNLWLFRGKAPVDGKEVEIVIKQFRFTPQKEGV